MLCLVHSKVTEDLPQRSVNCASHESLLMLETRNSFFSIYESIQSENIKHVRAINWYIHPRTKVPTFKDSTSNTSSFSSSSSADGSSNLFSSSGEEGGEHVLHIEMDRDQDMLYDVVRNGPSYWNRETCRLNAVTSFKGAPTFLTTLTEYSSNWPLVIQNIGQLLY
ncbi:unnamed protein product [Allacma fusca]|uniref:Uncharacterized protein n=1 Tax=Allacma fusca TaxID=39272 RepID=A0A8J2J8Q9_9HEXA|nr:unnamed protein product [Allacma fusca]